MTLPGGDALENFARSPGIKIPRRGRKPMRLTTDRVRARPAVTPTLSGTIGQTAIGLGLLGTLFPKTVSRMLGVRAPAPVVQTLFGLRELWTGYSLAGNPTRSNVLWARVAGDIFDLAVLKALDNRRNPRRATVRTALGFVLFVTALDVITASRMTDVKRNCV